jgi:hypothetical protein
MNVLREDFRSETETTHSFQANKTVFPFRELLPGKQARRRFFANYPHTGDTGLGLQIIRPEIHVDDIRSLE